jgi:hypothetical protein
MKKSVITAFLSALAVIIIFSEAACTLIGGGKTIKNIEELKEYLDSQPANSPDKPIKIKLKEKDPFFPKISAVITSSGKYVRLNLSGNSITTIQKYAFYDKDAEKGCEMLVGITIPNSVFSIGDSAFAYCTNLTGITLGKNVTTIGQGAFNNCTGLTKISLPKNITGIGEGAFFNCTGLTGVKLPNAVTGIESYTFSGCTGLTGITIPKSVTIINSMAFADCTGLKKIKISGGVTEIGKQVFQNCTALNAINVKSGNKNFSSARGVLYNNDKTSLILYPKGKTGIFKIPNTVKSLEDDAFFGCDGLTEINVKSSNKNYSSDQGILYNKNKTELILFPPGKTDDFTIPDSVTVIGKNAFYGCANLTDMTIPNSITGIGDCAFIFCGNLASVTIGDNVTGIGEAAFAACTGLTDIIIPDNVTSIGEQAFAGCTGLTSVIIGNGVNSIVSGKANYGVFYGCTSLTSVTLGSGVTSIGANAFYDCTSLTSVTFQSKITANNFDRYAFRWFTSDEKSFRLWTTDLRTKYFAGGIGTYTTTEPLNENSKWTKQSGVNVNVSKTTSTSSTTAAGNKTKRGTLYTGNEHSYEINNQTMTWTEAKQYCEGLGGYLATITNQAEQTFIENLVSSNGNKKAYWLGGYGDTNDKFAWITNEPMSFTNWAPNEPNNTYGVQNKMAMVRIPYGNNGVQLGQWDDEDDNLYGSMPGSGNGFIIEWN